jgi:hypothetical protein
VVSAAKNYGLAVGVSQRLRRDRALQRRHRHEKRPEQDSKQNARQNKQQDPPGTPSHLSPFNGNTEKILSISSFICQRIARRSLAQDVFSVYILSIL